MNPYSRRHFLTSASSTAISAVIAACSTNRGPAGSNYRLGFDYERPACFSKDANAFTPLAKSVLEYLEAKGSSSVMVIYRGYFAAAKQNTRGFDSGNRRAGELTTSIRYSRGSGGSLETHISQTLNGLPLNGRVAPVGDMPLDLGLFAVTTATAIRFSDLPSPVKSVPIHVPTGIGAPGLNGTISKKNLTISLRAAGTKFTAPLGKQVPVWRWSGVERNQFRPGMQAQFESLLSPAIPGQLESFSYTYVVDGRTVDESRGQLVEIR